MTILQSRPASLRAFRHSASVRREQTNPYNYFLNLRDNFTNGKIFEKNWRAITTADIAPQELVAILENSSKFFSSSDDEDLAEQGAEFVFDNFQIWEKKATENIHHFSIRNIIGCLNSCSNLDIIPSGSFLKKIEERALDIMQGENNPEDNLYLNALLKSYAQLDIRPSEEFLQTWEKTIARQIPAFNTTQFTNVLWAYATLGLCPSIKISEELKDRAPKITKEFQQTHILNNLRSCAIIHCISADERFREIALDFHSRVDLGALQRPIDINQFRQASLWFDLPCPIDPEPREETVSLQEERLISAFKISKTPLKEHIIPVMGHKVDVAVDGEHLILIEVDGRWHFVFEIDNEGNYVMAGYNGSTLFQTALMEKYSGKNVSIIRAPYDALKPFLDNPGRLDLRQQIASLFSNVKPGTYILEADGLYEFNINMN